ncbi:ABC transporter substrate-binding protein [Petroclostridium sp. X23]|uniref:ABC transporter substrate-binding protein n=1 Tax=Petroclostridium sp. X23 TaxID=3045146 RepID=UPI0024AE3FB8|nr:ABC transporter substrate-binding protein [Petroclostridium sp. X23]WHH58783.1 ABC transporter substrate-binding protein [Petroclostridium sp. X23]
MKQRLFLSIYAVLFMFLYGCSGAESAQMKEIYVPILGDAQWIHEDAAFLNGVTLAVEDLNNEYGEKGFIVRTGVEDDQDIYEAGVELADKLSRDKAVTAVFNLQNFDVSNTTADMLTDSGKLVILPYGAYDALMEQDNPYIFCPFPSSTDVGKVMADYVVAKGYKRIAVYVNGTEAQDTLVSALELALQGRGAKVIDYVPVIASQNDFDRYYSRWEALSADCIVIAQYGLERSYEIVQMIREKNKNIPIIGEAILNSASILNEKKDLAEGLVVPSTLVLEESEKLDQFKSRYRTQYGSMPDVWAVQGYDMMRMLVDTAVRLNTNDPMEIAAALHDEKGYSGVGRHIAFEKGGALKVDISRLPMLICRDGKFKEK